jgi:aspartyl/glutamyl-tRNA(Asn/Gln) amidotransferase C subunit
MISKDEVLNLAGLARLKLTEGEVESLQKDISSILDYVGQVSAAPIETRTDQKPEPRNIMREDSPRDERDTMAHKEESLRAAFPTREGNYNVVRKIIQKDE